VGEGIKLVLAFEDLRGFVDGMDGVTLVVGAGFEAGGRRWLECVAVGCGDYVLGLSVDGSKDEVGDVGIVFGETLILCKLVCAVSGC
jgi:hypothetical protein